MQGECFERVFDVGRFYIGQEVRQGYFNQQYVVICKVGCNILCFIVYFGTCRGWWLFYVGIQYLGGNLKFFVCFGFIEFTGGFGFVKLKQSKSFV